MRGSTLQVGTFLFHLVWKLAKMYQQQIYNLTGHFEGPEVIAHSSKSSLYLISDDQASSLMNISINIQLF